MPSRTVGEFGVNACGRDLVVGDVHGCFRTLEHALGAITFDPDRDRLFGVGDLVERGPHSIDALEWMERRFTGVTRGNHEDAALTWLEDRLDGSCEAAYGWLRHIAPGASPTRPRTVGHPRGTRTRKHRAPFARATGRAARTTLGRTKPPGNAGAEEVNPGLHNE